MKILLLVPVFIFLFIVNVIGRDQFCILDHNLVVSDSIPNEPDGSYWKKLNNEQKIILTEGIATGIRAFYTEMFSFPNGENLFRDSNFTKRMSVMLGNDPKNAAEEDSSLLLMMLETLIKFSPREQQPVSLLTESIDRFYDNENNMQIPVSYGYKYCVFVMNVKENIVNTLPAERLTDYIERLRQFYKNINEESLK